VFNGVGVMWIFLILGFLIGLVVGILGTFYLGYRFSQDNTPTADDPDDWWKRGEKNPLEY